MAHDVFISHSAKDKTIADAVCATLESRDIRCWIAPRDILPGQEWDTAIIEGIKSSTAMVLVFSAHSNDSVQVHREVKAAFSKGITVIPLRLDDVPLSEKLEFYLGSVHWLDAMTSPLERHSAELADSILSVLQTQARQSCQDSRKDRGKSTTSAARPQERQCRESSAGAYGPCEESGQALAFVITGIICHGVALGIGTGPPDHDSSRLVIPMLLFLSNIICQIIAVVKALKAKKKIKLNHQLIGSGKATAALIIAATILIWHAMFILSVLSRVT